MGGVKFMSNAEALSKDFKERITVERMNNWASAALINVMNGTARTYRILGFPQFVRANKLSNGSALNVGSEYDKKGNYVFRGWHHYEAMTYYKTSRKRPEVHIGLYGAAIRELGFSNIRNGSLNYMVNSIKEPNYIRDAWKTFKGQNTTRNELFWMFEHGIDKLTRESEKEVK